MRSMLSSTLRLFLALTLLCLAPRASRGDENEPVRLTVYPVAQPRPALKYQLLPEFMERTPGNAAVHYGKVTAEESAFFGSREIADNIDRWQKTPLEELRKDNVRLQLGSIKASLDRAARCEYCDWQLPIHEAPFYAMLLPELQPMRQFARILGAKARIQMAHGEYDEAVRTFQTGYAMGHDVAEGETIVNGWVGIAISNIMSAQVLEFVQQSDAPNLYWALTMLPRPLIDMRKGFEAEMNGAVLNFPELRDLNRATRSPDEWRESLHRFWRDFNQFSDESALKTRPEILVAASIKGYPVAKRALIERGRSPEAVEAMPVAQVIMLYTIQTYEDLRDDIFKWYYLPYTEALAGMRSAVTELRRAGAENREIIPLASIILPGVQASRRAIVRNDRKIAVLRVIEALRIYGASHEGRLPESLSDITEVPIPVDPFTGKPFDYQLNGDTARLQGPTLSGIAVNYEITMARK